MGIRSLRLLSHLTAVVVALGAAGMGIYTVQSTDAGASGSTSPVIDGATFAQSLGLAMDRTYIDENADSFSLQFTGAARAFTRLLSGDADLLVTTKPTTAQEAAAKAAGVTLKADEVARAGLVFLTDAANSVDSLSLDQVRGIYSGKITDWSQVGGNPGKINANQPPLGSSALAAMTDVVMGGTPLMNPPTQSLPGPGGIASQRIGFDGQPGSLGFAYASTVAATWPGLEANQSADGIKRLKINGISPTDAAIRDNEYPLVTSIYLLTDKEKSEDSTVSRLVGSMLSPQGQALVRSSGFTPIGDAGPTSTASAPPVVSRGSTGLRGLDQTYQTNALEVTTVTQYVSGTADGVNHCAVVERVQISGLKNTRLQNSIINQFSQRQDSFLEQYWGTNRVNLGPACPRLGTASQPGGAEVELTTTVSGNFANLLSLVSTWTDPVSGRDRVAATLDLRLDNGAELKFADLFVPGTNLTGLVNSTVSANESVALAWNDLIVSDPGLSFHFSELDVTLDQGDGWELTLPYLPLWQDLALYDLASSADGLYVSDSTRATCPVLTSYQNGICWAGEAQSLGQVQVPSSGGNVTLDLQVAPQESWQIQAGDDFSGTVSPASGQGIGAPVAQVAANDGSASRQFALPVRVSDPATMQGYLGYIYLSQAARTVPAAPVISQANAAQVAGTVPLPLDQATTVSLTWPDASVSSPIPVGEDGSWQVATPTGMTMGLIHVVAQNAQGASTATTIPLDIVIPDPPVVAMANAAIVSGSTGRGTTVTLTWPDHSVIQAQVNAGQWLARTPAGMISGPLTVQASDAAGNISEALTTDLDTLTPGQPQISHATAAEISGTLPPPQDPGTFIQVAWPGNRFDTVPLSPDGTWAVAVPAGSLDSGGTVSVTAQDPAGNISAATNIDVDKPTVDLADSSLTLTSQPFQITAPACGQTASVSADSVTAELTVMDTAGRLMPAAVARVTATAGLMPTADYVTTDDQGQVSLTGLIELNSLVDGAQPTLSVQLQVNGVWQDVTGSPLAIPFQVIHQSAPMTTPTLSLTSSGAVPADNASTQSVTVRWTDGCGLPVVGAMVDFSVDGHATLSDSSVQLDADGQAQIQVRDAVAETVSVTAVVDSAAGPVAVDGAPASLVFSPATPDLAQSSLRVDHSLVDVGCGQPGSTMVTVMVKDVAGHPLPGVSLDLSADGQAVLTPATVVTDISGNAQVELSDQTAETVSLSAGLTADGSAGTVAGSPVDVTFVDSCAPPASSALWFVVSEGPKLANATDAYTVTIYARDVNGSAVKGLANALTVTDPTGTLAITAVTANDNGTYSARVSSATAGTFSLQVTMTDADGTRRSLANSPVDVDFLPLWSSLLTARVTELASTPGDYLVSVTISARMGVSASAPLVGQSSLLSAVVAGDGSEPSSASLAAGAFSEVQPGVYVARLSAPQASGRDLIVSWKEPGATLVTSRIGLSSTPASAPISGGTGISRVFGPR